MSCENLEDELNEANSEIALLEAQVNKLSADLQDAIALNNTQAQQLAELESMIVSLNSDLETAYGANIFLGNEIGELTAQLSALNEEIAILQADLATALDNSADEATIQSLVDQIAVLEAIEPEVVIEYITVVETVIETVTVTETVTEYVPTEYDAETVTIEDLRDELSRLQDIVDEAVASQTTIVTEVETSEERLESYWILDVNGDGDMLDTYVRIETQDVTYNYDGEAIFFGELTVVNSVTIDVAPEPAVTGVTFSDVEFRSGITLASFIGEDVAYTFDVTESLAGIDNDQVAHIIIGDNTHVGKVNTSSGTVLGLEIELTQSLIDDINSGSQIDIFVID